MGIVSRRWLLVVLASMIALGVAFQIPQWLQQRDPRSQGILVHLNSDEYVYLARVEEALSGRPEQSAEAIVGDPQLHGSQPAMLERAIGTMFRPLRWRAAMVFQVMDSATPPLIFLGLIFLFLLCGFGRWPSLLAALVFSVIEFYNLGRPVHQRESFLLLLLAMIGITAGVERRWFWGIGGGVFLGLLFGDYFWSWSFGWLWFGLLLLWKIVEWLHLSGKALAGLLVTRLSFDGQYRNARSSKPETTTAVRSGHRPGWQRPASRKSRCTDLLFLLFVIVIGLLVASPFLTQLWGLMHHPFYEAAVFRSGLRPGHLPESWVYGGLFLTMAASVLWLVTARPEDARRHRPAILLILTAAIAIHQQAVHGAVFNFVSHYLFGLAAAAVSMILLAWSVRRAPLLLGAAAASVYLAVLAYDGRHAIKQFQRIPGRFTEQHFASLLPLLDGMSRVRILSDPDTSLFLAASTTHDVVYTIYLKNILLPHEEIARRYCVTQLPLPPHSRRIAEQPHLIYPDANGAFKDPAVRRAEVEMVEEACAWLDRDPAMALRAYGIDLVLWDEKRVPEWNLARLRVRLELLRRGEGWSLWRIGDRDQVGLLAHTSLQRTCMRANS